MKITIVYESMFGNTNKVAQAISDGVREAHPDADVECVAVGNASPELIKSTDLLVVGGPTHIRHMTTGFSRKMQISEEKKAEVKGEPTHELELDAAGPDLREWFHQLPKAKEGGQAAAFDTRLGSALAGGAAYGIAHRLHKHGYYVVKNPEGFVVDDAHGPLHEGEIERAKEWGAQLVRASVNTTTKPVANESKESKNSAALTRRPENLTDLWAGWPLGPIEWPFLDINAEEFIKVEEFIDGDHLVIRAELPGVDPDRDIDVSVDNDVLTIAAERQESSREKFGKGYRSEFRYGSFVRQVRLPTGTSAEVVSAAYKDGVLEIRMPRPTPEAASRRIQIQRA
jgi:HSP20 family molecular chaperone IbpA